MKQHYNILQVTMANTELSIAYRLALTPDNPFDQKLNYQFTLNGTIFDSSFYVPSNMTEQEVHKKLVYETLNQMLSRVAWESVRTTQHNWRSL